MLGILSLETPEALIAVVRRKSTRAHRELFGSTQKPLVGENSLHRPEVIDVPPASRQLGVYAPSFVNAVEIFVIPHQLMQSRAADIRPKHRGLKMNIAILTERKLAPMFGNKTISSRVLPAAKHRADKTIFIWRVVRFWEIAPSHFGSECISPPEYAEQKCN